MELSKEILLVNGLLSGQNCDDKLVIQLIRDICQGLDIPISLDEKDFLKTKISFHLLSLVLQEDNQLKIPTHHLLSSRNAHLTWPSFFKISVQCNLMDSLFALLMENLPKETLQFVFSKFCQEITQFKISDVLSSLCIIATQILSHPSEVAVTAIDGLVESLMKQKSTFSSVEAHHVESLKQALKPFQKLDNVKVAKDLDIAVLKQLQSLSGTDVLNSASIDNLVEKLQKRIFSTCHLNSTSKVSFDVPIYLKNFFVKLISLLEKSLVEWQNIDVASKTLLDVYCKCLQEYMQNLSETVSQADHPKAQKVEEILVPKWDFKSALFCASHLLQNYDSAVGYLLTCMFDSSLSSQDMDVCFKTLLEVPECLMQSKHVISLCQVIRALESSTVTPCSGNLQCSRDLLASVFALLPLRSKQVLLEQRCSKNDVDNGLHHSILHLRGDDLIIMKKINLVFNKMTKIDVGVDFHNFLHNFCDIAFIAPLLTLKKLVDHVASHEENHDLLIKVFQHLPCVLTLEKDGTINHLLHCIIQTVEQHKQDNMMKNISNFLTLVLRSVYVTKNVEIYFSKQILRHYVLIVFSGPPHIGSSTNASIDFALNLIQCISHTFTDIDASDVFMLSYQLARLLDNGCMPDFIFVRIKAALLKVVGVLCERFNANEMGIESKCVWLQHSASAFLWTTQLYLRPLLKNCRTCKVVIPDSIKSICAAPEDESICFDSSFGDGTGLTVWLQCLIIDPSLFPISSLNVQQLSKDEQQLFKLGMTVALSQVLPSCFENDWQIILEALKSLFDQNCLYVAYPLRYVKMLPFMNLEKFRNPLCVLELLHQVTHLLGNDCCKSWMNSTLWIRYARCFAMSVKQMLTLCSENDANLGSFQHRLFFLSQLFFHSCDFLIMLQNVSDGKSACDFLYVLLLDILTMFCSTYELLLNTSSSSIFEMETLKSSIQANVESIKNTQKKSALFKKLLSLS